MPRAIFFDMDDTILDTSRGVEESWTIAAAAFAPTLNADPEALHKAIRREGMEFWKDEAAVGHWRLDLEGARRLVVRNALVAEGLDPEYAERIAVRYRAEVMPRMQLFDDSLETLDWLRSAGYRLGLITNGPREMQREKIARFEIEHYFDVIVIEGEFGHGKPSPHVFTHALTTTGASANEAWHVGDNLYADVGGAQAVGVHAVWIHRDRLEMKENPDALPDRVVAHLHELRAALD